MGSAVPVSAVAICEPSPAAEVFFTDVEIEVVCGKCARFLLVAEQRPVESLHSEPEMVVVIRCTTLIELVPAMIAKTVFALGRHWGNRVTRSMLKLVK